MAVFLGFVGVLGFSGSLPATRVAVEGLDPTFVGVGRAVVAGVLAAALLAVSRQPRPTRVQLRPLGLVAVLVFAGAQGAGVPSAADGLVLIAVAFGALGYAQGGALSRQLGGWQTICWALVLSLPLTVPVTLVAGLAGDLSAGADAWAGFAYVSLVSMFLGFFAWYAALARGGIARIGQVQLAQPVLTLAVAPALLGEHVSAGMVAASLLVLACVVATQRTRVGLSPRPATGLRGVRGA